MLSVGTVVCESPLGAHTPCSLQTKMRCTLICPSLSSYGNQLKKEEEEEHWFMNRFAVIMSYLPGASERRHGDDTYLVGSAKSVRGQPWGRTHLQLAWLASSSEMINIFILGVLVTTFKAAVKV